MATSEPLVVETISSLEPFSDVVPKSASLYSKPPPTENLHEPLPLESNVAEQEDTGKISTNEPLHPVKIPQERNDDISLLENDNNSDISSDRDEGHEVGERSTLQPKPSVKRVVSTVDPALLDPALRQQTTREEIKPETSSEVTSEPVNSTGLSNAELTAIRVISAPLKTDTPKMNTVPPSSFPKGRLGSTVEAISVEAEKDVHIAASPKEPVVLPTGLTKHDEPLEVRIASPLVETTISGPSTVPKSPKGESKVSSWLKTKFSRRTSKSSKPEVSDPIKSSSSNFIATGAAIIPNIIHKSQTGDEPSLRDNEIGEKEGSNPEEGKLPVDELQGANQLEKQRQGSISSSVSSLSNDEGARGRSNLQREETSSSHDDEFEEARDHFDTERLAPPVTLRDFGRGSDSPVRDSKFQEDL